MLLCPSLARIRLDSYWRYLIAWVREQGQRLRRVSIASTSETMSENAGESDMRTEMEAMKTQLSEVATLKDQLADLTALITRQAAALQALTQQTVANPPAAVVQQGVNQQDVPPAAPTVPTTAASGDSLLFNYKKRTKARFEEDEFTS